MTSPSRSLVSAPLAEAINAQIGREFGASLQYVALGGYFAARGLPQLAAFFRRQSDEERLHALKFVDFLLEAGAPLRLPAIPPARHAFDSALEAVEAALAWEHDVTDHINELMARAVEERNFMAQGFLQWFVTEQLEEIASMGELADTVRHAGEGQLLAVEDYVARRPAPASGAGPGAA